MFLSPMPTSTCSSLSARSRLSSQSIAVARPDSATPRASAPISRPMASHEPRSDQPAAAGSGTAAMASAFSITA